MRWSFLFLFLFLAKTGFTQLSYRDSLQLFRVAYIEKHEVVKGEKRDQLRFFPINPEARVIAAFEKKEQAPWFLMESSGPVRKMYRVYGVLRFRFGGQDVQLNLYQSQNLLQSEEYMDYLFLPFTDATSGQESYAGGRYIDIRQGEIRDKTLAIDFNKAYNPYCAYVSNVYNCPIPPAENRLSIPIRAGEMQLKDPAAQK